jgi:hypothetical protein
MSRGAYSHRVDENQQNIVKTFRKLGASVLILSEVGKGCPDILIGMQDAVGERHNILIEIKDGNKMPSQQKLTQFESKFFDNWKGYVCIIRSQEEAINLFNSIRQGTNIDL